MEVSTSSQERSYSKPVLESYLDLLSRGLLSDVTFIVGPSKERIPCHRAILAARSTVFEVMFSERWNQDKEIPLEHFDPKIFKKFLQFMYADTFVANLPEVVELLQVARFYDVQLLVSRCEEELLADEVPLIDAVDAFQAARKYDMIELMERAGDVIAKSLSEVQSLPSFSRVDKETLVFILNRDFINMEEVDLFRLAVKWTTTQSDLTMEESLEDILPLIRFPVMTLEEFTATVVPTGLLSQSTLVGIFTYFGSDAETKKSLAETLNFHTQNRRPIHSVQYFNLYSGDLDGKETNVRKLGKLEDSLRIGNGRASVGIYGISVYCPARVVSTESRPAYSTFKEFKIVLEKTAFTIANRKILLSMSPVKAEEGKMTEIKFDTVVLLKREYIHRIIVEELPPRRTQWTEREDYYAAKVFDRIPRWELSLNNASVIITSEYPERLGGIYGHPQLICRFGFVEL